MAEALFLPGVPAAHVRDRLSRAGGNELESGKFASAESSAALAVNTFGWFVDRPADLPTLPGLEDSSPAEQVEVEWCARFPWSGGRHPWLDAMVRTSSSLIGIESKRFEPFPDAKAAHFSAAYDRPVWGDAMERFHLLRRALTARSVVYRHLDAAQLIKHAYGLVTQARDDRRPVLFYLFAEPGRRGDHPITADDLERHRAEIDDFAARVEGDDVAFAACSYREWLRTWRGAAADHAEAVVSRFAP